MFSRDDRGDDLFTNSTIDTSNPDKIIIREKDAPKKKVRRRVKKDGGKSLLSEKTKKTGKVKVTKSRKNANETDLEISDLNDVRDIFSPVREKPTLKNRGKYNLPRLSEMEKKKDDYDQDISSNFRNESADWRDRSIPDYSGLDKLDESSGWFEGIKSASVLQWIALALAVLVFVSSILTVNVYAERDCRISRQQAMNQLVTYEENSFEQVAESVETVEAPISMEEAKPQLGKAVTLVLSSVEKDLKIKLVDEDETLVRNVAWSVTVADTEGNSSEQADDDKDGIIHMTDVSAGDYSVTLNPSDDLADFALPATASVVSVKAKVEYKVIQDIKEEIKSEKEINAAVEDAAGNQAADVETSTPVQDTVEWVESSKTINGENYVEAQVDLGKTASIKKKDSPLLAALEKTSEVAKNGTGTSVLGYPLFLDPIEHEHEYGAWSDNGDGTHKRSCTAAECTETESGTCDTSGEGGKCSKCGHPSQPSHTHSLKYTSNDNGTHAVTCEAADCTGGITTPETCDTAGDGGKCSKCGYKAQGTHTHSLKYTSTNDGKHTVVCETQGCPGGVTTPESCDTAGDGGKCSKCGYKAQGTQTAIALQGTASVKVGETTTITISITPATVTPSDATIADTSIATASRNGNTVTVKGVKAGSTVLKVKASDGKEAQITITVTEAAQQQYSDDAQLYDSNKNALYVKDGDKFRLAKYKDYRINSSQKFYRKEEAYKYTGWQTIDNKTYYFTKDNVAVTGDQIIGGVKYHFGTDGALAQGNGTLGIDVSKYQPSINWASVRASGVNYVIIRCGYRGSSTGVLVEDPYFKSHIKGAKAAGLKVGIYFFTTAVSEAEAVEEASMVAYLCKGYGIDYPVFMDCESSSRPGYNGMSASQRTAIIKAFCNTIRSAGYTPGVYANKTWLTSYMHAGELSGYKIWLAQYNSAGPTYTGRYDLWQYTSKGSVNGISGYVDMNQSYLGY